MDKPLRCFGEKLVQPSDVVLSEDAAERLVDAVGCPAEAVLGAGPAPGRLGCAQQRRGERQENDDKPDSLHGTNVPAGVEQECVFQMSQSTGE